MTLILSGTDGLSDVDGTAATPAIRGTDTNTGLFFPAADTVAASVGGTEGLRLTSTGLGVGTSTPAYAIHAAGNVNGNVTVASNNTNAGTSAFSRFLALADAGNAQFGMTSSAYTDITGATDALLLNANNASGGMAFALDGVLRMKLDSSGNLGVGTSSPVSKLEVYNSAVNGAFVANTTSTWRVAQIRNDGTVTAGNAAGIAFVGRTDVQPAGIAAIQSTTGGGNVSLSFMYVGGNTTTEGMRLNSSGNLGVGTTTINYRVVADCAGSSSNDNGISVYNDNNSAYGGSYNFEHKVTSGGSVVRAAYISSEGGGGTSFLRFATTNASTLAERIRITSAGYLLVGTTSAVGDARLVVNNPDNVSGDFGFVTTLGSNCNNTSSYHYIAATGAADKFYIYGNGNVVNTNGSYGTLSDVKLKENIVDATPKLADVMRLQVRNFNLKTEPGHKQIGFVAQEFEQVFPAMVDESPDRDEEGNQLETTTKHIKTSVLVPILVKAIQELKAELDSVKAELNALKGT
jgi:hypothetical protein